MPAGAGNPPNIKMEPPKSNFNIRGGGGSVLILGGRDYTILHYTILYYTILYYTILYYTILYHTILYYTITWTLWVPEPSI